MKRWMIPVMAVVVIAVGVGCFFAGRSVGDGSVSAEEAMAALQSQGAGGTGDGGSFPAGGRGNGGNAEGTSMISGSIVSVDSDTITVKLSDDSTKLIIFSGSTTISKTEAGSSADLAAGTEISVSGSTNSDGSVTATRISIGNLDIGGTMPSTNGATTTTSAAE
jgi:hypothetical protein